MSAFTYFLSALSFVVGVPLVTILIWLALQPLFRHFERSEWPGDNLRMVSDSPDACQACWAVGYHHAGCRVSDVA